MGSLTRFRRIEIDGCAFDVDGCVSIDDGIYVEKRRLGICRKLAGRGRSIVKSSPLALGGNITNRSRLMGLANNCWSVWALQKELAFSSYIEFIRGHY